MSFDYPKICSNLLKDLPSRTSSVVERRFGLKNQKRETLESIGKDYSITRERVRQIEEEGFLKIRPKIKKCQTAFKHFNDTFKSLGDLKKEETLLFSLGQEKYQNQVFFLLNLTNDFERFSENGNFHCFWAINKESVDSAKKVINLTLDKLKKENQPFALDKLFIIQKPDLSKILKKKLNKDIFHSYIEISKKIQKNPEDEFGLKDWVEINPKGIKDKAYLILKKQGKALHFTQVADLIKNSCFSSQKNIHTATVHNELIKDPRFVLIGRGLYSLKEWGYEPGVVKEVISKILKDSKKPLLKQEILKKVLEQRLVKENTVCLNLQDKNCFSKDFQGRYTINKS